MTGTFARRAAISTVPLLIVVGMGADLLRRKRLCQCSSSASDRSDSFTTIYLRSADSLCCRNPSVVLEPVPPAPLFGEPTGAGIPEKPTCHGLRISFFSRGSGTFQVVTWLIQVGAAPRYLSSW